MTKKLIKMYLKSIKPDNRCLRLMFLGKRLKWKQLQWTHFNNHPQEFQKE